MTGPCVCVCASQCRTMPQGFSSAAAAAAPVKAALVRAAHPKPPSCLGAACMGPDCRAAALSRVSRHNRHFSAVPGAGVRLSSPPPPPPPTPPPPNQQACCQPAHCQPAHQCIPAGGPSKHRLTLIITGALAVQSVATRHTGPCSGTGVWHVPPPPFAVLLPILLPVQLLSCALPIPWPIHFSANFRGSPHPRTHTAPGRAVELISCTTAQHKSLCAHPRMWLCTCTTLRACPCTFLCTHARTCLYVRAGGRACACARMRA